jgi:glyoxylase-like metal-dependent hydrolase (beta-lactamase superfamily II)
MTLHHLNCGTMRPYFPRLRAIVYCLLLETDDGLAMVDTGFGFGDTTRPAPLMRLFKALLRNPRDQKETAVRQVAALGYDPTKVRHIVCTHLHLDHAGGLPDFPQAKVHVYRPEYEAAMARRGVMGRFYRPEHWVHGPRWVLHELSEMAWFGFDCVPVVHGLSPEILLVPLPGHTPGHCGVAVQTGAGWLLHCGDAASPFYVGADPNYPHDVQANRLSRWLIGSHVPRLRALVRVHGDQVRLISGHDVGAWAETQSGSGAANSRTG